MLVEKPPDRPFAETMNRQAAPPHPVCKVGNATEVGIDGVRRIAVLGQMMQESVHMGREFAIEKPNCRAAVKSSSRVYHYLL